MRVELEIIHTKYLKTESERRENKLWVRKGFVLGALEELVGPNLAMRFFRRGPFRIGKQNKTTTQMSINWSLFKVQQRPAKVGTETVALQAEFDRDGLFQPEE